MKRFSWILTSSVTLAACSGDNFNTKPVPNDDIGESGGTSGASGGKTGSDTGGSSAGGSDSGGSSAGGSSAGGSSAGGSSAGGSSSGGSSAGGSSSGGSGTGGGGPSFHDSCPPSTPNLASGCENGLVCGYGDDPRHNCRQMYTCADNRWSTGAVSCTPLITCESMAPRPADDVACTTAGETCWYSSRTACSCKGAMTWNCETQPPECPALVPNVGASCGSDVRCIYGPCPSLAVHTEMRCKDNTWSKTGHSCF